MCYASAVPGGWGSSSLLLSPTTLATDRNHPHPEQDGLRGVIRTTTKTKVGQEEIQNGIGGIRVTRGRVGAGCVGGEGGREQA